MVLAFRTTPPNFADTPPVVRMQDFGPQFWQVFIDPSYYVEPGENVFVMWTARDNAGAGIVSQRVIASRELHDDAAFEFSLAAGLPPTQRSVEVTVPDVGFAFTGSDQYLRVVATDAAGQDGWDETQLQISTLRITGELDITTDLTGQTFHWGDGNGGKTWRYVVQDLPPTARKFDWRLPASSGVPDLRIRVIARDRRFENSSDESGALAVTPGGQSTSGDVDGDGVVGLSDLTRLLSALGTCRGQAGFYAGADFDSSGCVDLGDLAVLQAHFGT